MRGGENAAKYTVQHKCMSRSHCLILLVTVIAGNPLDGLEAKDWRPRVAQGSASDMLGQITQLLGREHAVEFTAISVEKEGLRQ